mmetsp:Transcript_8109/g.12258  ORF Transcript_8109/g.12258 Transcript_8109/m.12258 type:complete len:736 (-) Transcript_8109:286-2493(-)
MLRFVETGATPNALEGLLFPTLVTIVQKQWHLQNKTGNLFCKDFANFLDTVWERCATAKRNRACANVIFWALIRGAAQDKFVLAQKLASEVDFDNVELTDTVNNDKGFASLCLAEKVDAEKLVRFISATFPVSAADLNNLQAFVRTMAPQSAKVVPWLRLLYGCYRFHGFFSVKDKSNATENLACRSSTPQVLGLASVPDIAEGIWTGKTDLPQLSQMMVDQLHVKLPRSLKQMKNVASLRPMMQQRQDSSARPDGAFFVYGETQYSATKETTELVAAIKSAADRAYVQSASRTDPLLQAIRMVGRSETQPASTVAALIEEAANRDRQNVHSPMFRMPTPESEQLCGFFHRKRKSPEDNEDNKDNEDEESAPDALSKKAKLAAAVAIKPDPRFFCLRESTFARSCSDTITRFVQNVVSAFQGVLCKRYQLGAAELQASVLAQLPTSTGGAVVLYFVKPTEHKEAQRSIEVVKIGRAARIQTELVKLKQLQNLGVNVPNVCTVSSDNVAVPGVSKSKDVFFRYFAMDLIGSVPAKGLAIQQLNGSSFHLAVSGARTYTTPGEMAKNPKDATQLKTFLFSQPWVASLLADIVTTCLVVGVGDLSNNHIAFYTDLQCQPETEEEAKAHAQSMTVQGKKSAWQFCLLDFDKAFNFSKLRYRSWSSSSEEGSFVLEEIVADAFKTRANASILLDAVTTKGCISATLKDSVAKIMKLRLAALDETSDKVEAIQKLKKVFGV